MTQPWQLPNASEAHVHRIAELIALKLRAGDVVMLEGDLGAGKTTCARALVRGALADVGLDVPSPTFALIQTYDAARITLHHLDLYRLEDANDLIELGLDDLVSTGALIVEWPDRLDQALSPNTLTVALSDGADREHRAVTLMATGSWSPRLARIQETFDFLQAQSQWDSAHLTFLQGDASARSYARIVGGPAPALLMDSPTQPDGPPIHNGKTYSQMAGLAESVRPFVAISGALREAGLAAPDLHAADLTRGLLLVEDFGDLVFGSALRAGLDQHLLWQTAVDVLLQLRRDIADHTWSFSDDTSYRLPVFTADVMQTECSLLLDWYWPYSKGTAAPNQVRQHFEAVTQPLFTRTSRCNRNWVLRDFHSPNLIWRPDQTGLARVGLIDFQDALRGPAEYDLVSLLQDARIDVPSELEQTVLQYYLDQVGAHDNTDNADDFDRDETLFRYAVLGAQRAMKILGIFARLAKRDLKPQYLDHLPRIWRYLDRNLAHPELRELKLWIDQHVKDDIRIAPSVS